MRPLYLACLALAAVRNVAFAADTGTGNPAGAAPIASPSHAGARALHVLNQADRLFVRELAISGGAEVQAGLAAERKGRAGSVKDFAHHMVEDHRGAKDQLARIAKSDKVPEPDQLDEEHKAAQRQLDELSGAAYDLTYIREQIADHQKTVQLLEWEIGAGEDMQLKSFSADGLPIVLRHLEMARTVEDELSVG